MSARFCGACPIPWQEKCGANFITRAENLPDHRIFPELITGRRVLSLEKENAGFFTSAVVNCHPHPLHIMKSLLLIPVLGLVLATSSCRSSTPLDPNTMKPNEHCLPENVQPAPASGPRHTTIWQ